jgi:hypothetical protein
VFMCVKFMCTSCWLPPPPPPPPVFITLPNCYNSKLWPDTFIDWFTEITVWQLVVWCPKF